MDDLRSSGGCTDVRAPMKGGVWKKRVSYINDDLGPVGTLGCRTVAPNRDAT